MREKNLNNITLSMILISSALLGTDSKELLGKNELCFPVLNESTSLDSIL